MTTRKAKKSASFLRMCGNVASGMVSRYSTKDLQEDKSRRQRIAEVSVDIARRILKEAR